MDDNTIPAYAVPPTDSAAVSLDFAAPPEQTVKRTLNLRNPNGVPFKLDVEYYVNRVNGEEISDERTQAYLDGLGEEYADILAESNVGTLWKNAIGFCDIAKSWGMVGPLRNLAGEVIIPNGEPIPLEPVYIRLVSSWLTAAINDELMYIVFPNRQRSKKSRKR